MAVANKELIREINRFNILNAIRNAGAISRVELAELTGQSRAAVTNITARLLEEGLIYAKERVEQGRQRGRKRVRLAINPQAAYVVGVKLSSFRVSVAVTDMQAEVQSHVIVPVRTQERAVEFVADLIEDGIRHCVSEVGLHLEGISGIGIGLPGFIDSRSGSCFWTPLYTDGKLPLRELLENRFEIPTYIENDTNTVTLAHQWFGEGRGHDNFLVVTLEDGVGMGIVVNGQLYRGAHGFAAEFGHLVIDAEGRRCRCGKIGCIEAYASNFSIVAAARAALEAGTWQWPGEGELTYDAVIAAAETGAAAPKAILARAGTYLGQGIAGLVQLFNPSRIIMSGDGIRAGDLMFAPMRAAIDAHVNPGLRRDLEVVIHKWRDIDWARGAASLVLQELYKSPFNRVRPVI
ncbi:MAG: ROK family transcriptional regulator [Desulfosarcinaceae bacterium]|nr:ROK family transcriptional regulator [Desulfosarcinaceae bacterium]